MEFYALIHTFYDIICKANVFVIFEFKRFKTGFEII